MDEPRTPDNFAAMLRNAPAVRQVLLLLGLAVSIAVGLSAALWLRQPAFTTLYSGLAVTETAEVLGTLQATGIEFELDQRNGEIRVPAAEVYAARLGLAAAGLPRGAGFGPDLLRQAGGAPGGQFTQTTHYQQALETELARTIANFRPIQSARVHAGLPLETVTAGDRSAPRASVFVHLYPGRRLEHSQVAAITYLVASSIPELDTADVTVIDQNGMLLSGSPGDDEVALGERQFDYVQRLERNFADRIVALLSPVLGPEAVRATVTADVDFTSREESREEFDPSSAVVRSEQLEEDRNSAAAVGGPDAVSVDAAQLQPEPLSESVRQIRSFELDRTLSVTRSAAGTVSRLSIAVIIDDAVISAHSQAALVSPDAAESSPGAMLLQGRESLLAEVERLVRQAVGFDTARGDTIALTTAPFYRAPVLPISAPPALYLQPDFLLNVGKQALSLAAILLVGWGIARPIVRMLTAPPATSGPQDLAVAGAQADPAELTFDQKVGAARQLVDRDAERVARLVREWVGADG